MKNKNILLQIIPVMLAFFAMGSVDLVGIASNYIKKDFELTDTMANLLPFMVFLWFFIFSVPTGLLMNKIGRKNTVLLSLIVTALALLVPLIGYNLTTILISFSLLGIGNTFMQVSLNPLIFNIITNDKLTSTLALGQLIKTIASFLAPLIAGWAAIKLDNWRLLFPIYAIVSALSFILLGITKIQETSPKGKKSSFKDCFHLLEKWQILLFFIGILVHVGIDAGINITAPKILMERLGMTLNDAGFSISLYFLFRIIGSLLGAFILDRFPINKFFIISVTCIALSVIGLLFSSNLMLLYISIGLAGFGNSNIFSMIFSKALQFIPEKDNEISGLMIMGISGGAIFPLLMGVSSDFLGSQIGAVIILVLPVVYLFFLSRFIKK